MAKSNAPEPSFVIVPPAKELGVPGVKPGIPKEVPKLIPAPGNGSVNRGDKSINPIAVVSSSEKEPRRSAEKLSVGSHINLTRPDTFFAPSDGTPRVTFSRTPSESRKEKAARPNSVSSIKGPLTTACALPEFPLP